MTLSPKGTAELTGFTSSSFSCNARLEMNGGTFVSEGALPSQLVFAGTIDLLFGESAPTLVAPSALGNNDAPIVAFLTFSPPVTVQRLNFLGGRVFCRQLQAQVIALYSSTDNSVSCKVEEKSLLLFFFFNFGRFQTMVSGVLQVRVYEASQPLSLSFEENLHLQENSSLVWVNSPPVEPALVIGSNAMLVVSRNVSLVKKKKENLLFFFNFSK